MNRIILIVLLVCGSVGELYPQNLVPNHDFSRNKTCNPAAASLLEDFVFDWFQPTPKPADSIYGNYYQAFYSDTCFGFKIGYDSIFSGGCYRYYNYHPRPKEGSGYISLMHLVDSFLDNRTWYRKDPPCSNNYSLYTSNSLWRLGRAFAEAKLKSPLTANKEYIIELHTMKAHPAEYAIANLGAYVSMDTFYHFDYKKYNIAPTVETNNYVYDNLHWYRVKGSFIASGGEEYITIGNFRRDNNTSFQLVPPDSNMSNHGSEGYHFDAVYLYLYTDTLFEVTLPPDTTLCPNDSITLNAFHDDGFKLEDTVKTFLWSTGSTDSSITITQPGWYWVKVEYNHRFWQSDTIFVDRAVPPYSSGLPPLEEGCKGDEITLKAQMDINRQLLWNTGQTGPALAVADSGLYWLSAISTCDTVVDSVLVNLIDCDTVEDPLPVYIPNAFSPNGDGLNDTWQIVNLPEENELVVFNRWGEVIYQRQNYAGNWRGTTRDGQPLRPGIYLYRLTYTAPHGKTEVVHDWLMLLDR